MSAEAYFVMTLALAAVVLLALEKVHLSVLGVSLVIAVAAWPGLVAAQDAVAGFANPAVVTVAALYIVGEGFLRTGAASILADKILTRTGGRETTVVFLVMVMAAALSAFVNNTLVVITFMPVVTSICQSAGLFPSRLLIPLSYASILGGMCTLVGTSTTLLVSGVVEDLATADPDRGLVPLGMFDTTFPGIVVCGVGLLYLGLVGRRFLPSIPSLAQQMGETREYVTEIAIGARSPLIGTAVEALREQAQAGSESGGAARPVMLVRNETLRWPPFRDMTLQAGDILMVSGRIQELTELQKTGMGPGDYDPASMTFFELAVTPSSSLIGQKLGNLALKSRYGAVVVALQRQGKHLRERLADMRLRSGDVLLVFGADRAKSLLRQSHEFNLIEGIDESIYRREKASTALAVAAAVVAMFVTGIVPIVIAALIGALAMVLTGCLNVRQAHSAVNWPILVFIGGTLALSKGLTNSRATTVMAGWIDGALGDLGPYALLIALYAGAILLTELLSNNAVAVILTPLAIELAEAAGCDYRPLLIAVALGASTSFANPMGYKTNLIVYGPGGYRFRNYVIIGLPLDILLGAVGILSMPFFHNLNT